MVLHLHSAVPVRRATRLAIADLTFDRLAIFLLFVAILGAACLMPAQSDTYWQLRAGADTVATGRVQLTDTLTHTVRGTYWPNHEWATEVLFYLLHRAGGFPLLTFGLALVVTAAWWHSWRLMAGPALVRVALVAVMAISSARLWSIRPQVLSLLALVLTVRLLVQGRERWLPLFFVVWANFHGGVVLGIAALAGAVAVRALVDLRSVARGGAVLAACILAACVTPLGPSLLTEVGPMLERSRAIGIQEWNPTSLVDPWNLPFWLAAPVIPWLAWRKRRRLDAADAAIIGASLALAALGVRTTRNVMPALLLMTPALARLAFQAVPAPERTRIEHPRLNAVFAMAAVVATCAWVGRAWAAPASRLDWQPLSARTIQAIADCRPNLYNLYDHGGYITWFVPGQPVFADGRQDPFPPALILDQVRAERTGDYAALFRRFDVNCAALPPGSTVATALVSDGWAVAARDARWLVLARPRDPDDR